VQHSWPSPLGGNVDNWKSGLVTPRIVLTALLLILVLSGCAGSKVRQTPPPRPILESLTVQDDGGICMGRQDSMELLLYLDQLEDGIR
jgi:hypothetical protein